MKEQPAKVREQYDQESIDKSRKECFGLNIFVSFSVEGLKQKTIDNPSHAYFSYCFPSFGQFKYNDVIQFW